MTYFEESDLAFDFDKRWNIFKFDNHPDYQKLKDTLEGTKAIDFLGIFDNKDLYFIEVKNFRGHRIETKKRLSNGELAVELAQKIRDSLACIIGAYHASNTREHWQPYAKLLCQEENTIKVILWLEHDLPSHPISRKKAMSSISVNNFKQKLRWLTNRVLVCNCAQPNLPDVQVTYLSRPPGK